MPDPQTEPPAPVPDSQPGVADGIAPVDSPVAVPPANGIRLNKRGYLTGGRPQKVPHDVVRQTYVENGGHVNKVAEILDLSTQRVRDIANMEAEKLCNSAEATAKVEAAVAELNKSDPGSTRAEPGRRGRRGLASKCSEVKFRHLVLLYKGDSKKIAKTLGASEVSVCKRIAGMLELRLKLLALLKSDERVTGQIPPEVLNKPDPVAKDPSTMLTEQLLLEDGGYAKMGVPQQTIDKLRNVHEVNVEFKKFLGRGVEDNYALTQLRALKLDAMLDDIYRRYLGPKAKVSISSAEKVAWWRIYLSGSEQSGKAFDRTMMGAQALIAMKKGGDQKQPETIRVKAAWDQQVPKHVRKELERREKEGVQNETKESPI